MSKPVLLQTASGKSLAPADIAFAGPDGQAPNEIWFKFWLDRPDLSGRLTLRVNDGQLTVKSSSTIPDLGNDAYRNFTTHRW